MTPEESLKALLAEHAMTASDLGRILGNRTLGAAILSGRRGLSKTHIQTLAEFFKVEPGLFIMERKRRQRSARRPKRTGLSALR